MAKFTVDTHLFRELGELLVSRESTALVELVKNSYDADATKVTVYGESLEEPKQASIVLVDNGNGMTPEAFQAGFLRIASRSKEGSSRRSPRFGRRFTGAKGVGRLAAHKLAWRLEVLSTPNRNVYGSAALGVAATIDWEKVESVESLDEIEATQGVIVKSFVPKGGASSGTKITLSLLKKRWTSKQRSDFFGEIDSFLPPGPLTQSLAKISIGKPLFVTPRVRDDNGMEKRFDVVRTGDLDVGDQQFENISSAADWVIDIDCISKGGVAKVRLLPTVKFASEFPGATPRTFRVPLNANANVSFQARILFQAAKSWARPGVRIYQEGFRVLPYGEQRNDWLELDEDYKRRGRNLRFLAQVPELAGGDSEDANLGLSIAGNSSYFGAVFLTTERSKSLRMLVNREGFEWSPQFEEVKIIVRTALDLLVRERASYTLNKRKERRKSRRDAAPKAVPGATAAREAIAGAIQLASAAVSKAGALIDSGNQRGAARALNEGLEAVQLAGKASETLISDIHATRLLAALGLQLSAYLHEVNGLMVMTRQISETSGELRRAVSGAAKTLAIQVDNRISELRRSIEKQAQYLLDVTSADARRRRSPQPIDERFESAVRLYEHEASRAAIDIVNRIETGLRTPVPMFSAELMLVFSNLLSNAIKAAGREGKIKASSSSRRGKVIIRIENTGSKVGLEDAERWFLPFQSTTASSDVFLGQGMGMGLPITRELLEDYGATVSFVRPSGSFSTAVEVMFPEKP